MPWEVWKRIKKVHFEDDDPLVEEDEDAEEDCENPNDGDLQEEK